MAAVTAVRALLCCLRSVTLLRNFGHIPAQSASTFLPRGFCNANSNELTENKSLVKNLKLLGVDVRKARLRQPGVLRKDTTNEKGLAKFLQAKGASSKVIASIISRYPRAITRSIEHLVQRWELWRDIFQKDEDIVRILNRSPESFFRSSDNGNLEKNIVFLNSLGLNTKDLHRLLTTAPRTVSNSVELNKQMVKFLEDICVKLGGKNPEEFPRLVISKNYYVLIRSTKRVETNIDILRASLQLSDSELLALLEGPGAEILDLSNEYLKNNFKVLKQRMVSLGCQEIDIKKLILGYPMILYIGADTLSTKLDCLLSGGITIKQILKKPKVLDYSTQNITGRLGELQKLGYDFEKSGINILDSSRKRFDAKMERLNASND
ncbi:transcription termination factor 1, mitochondrial [Pseudoliparis swirei]|uniref:transcription termination factor 1, mitochondrial n=1 Tax=Pseudoliparis swirei TaxID=2059687 RepID=UPI0024BE8DBB|nr:transcription termination factor 1, mitochondrial [Pseudoliparis swirei]XP_056271610.1 transcription termination factor 1, mitochondrial [Pseudoliparis swirei]